MSTDNSSLFVTDSLWTVKFDADGKVLKRHEHEGETWYPITASNSKRSTVAPSSGEAELVAALSGACEGMSLRQQSKWLLKFGCTAEETIGSAQQILCCGYSAALGMIKRKGSSRKTRHIELKAFFLQQWSARPEVRLVQVETSEVLSDCLTRIQSTPHSVHLSRLHLDNRTQS